MSTPSTSPTLERELTDVLDPFAQEQDDTGDHDAFSHYVSKEDIVTSAINGTPVKALCGKIWTPGKSPEKYPVCPECKDIYDNVCQPGDDE